MQRQSSRVAVGGVFSALCLVIMMLTIMPLGTYALPSLAGAMLAPVLIEVGSKTALMVYVSVSLLSVFIIPDKEAALLFLVFFGYYPILKEKLEGLRSPVLERVLKLTAFNLSVVGGYYLALKVIGITYFVDEFGEFGRYSMALLLLTGNVFFVLYDIALTRYIIVYLHRVRKLFAR